MKCPVCGDLGTRVIDSRSAQDGAEIRRRRECDSCQHRFTTFERARDLLPMVVKKDGRRETWDLSKILRGLTKACEKRPVSTDAVDRLADQIEVKISAGGRSEVPSREIGEQIMSSLREFDQVAYVRFASVYRSFEDVGAFVTEIAAMGSGNADEEGDE